MFLIATVPHTNPNTRVLQANRATWVAFIDMLNANGKRSIARVLEGYIRTSELPVIRVTLPTLQANLILAEAGISA